MPLIHLLYVSTASADFDSTQLAQVLDSSARHNAPQEITGMLLYAAGNFMQVLEGEAAAVDETYARILKDPRHSDVFLLERAPIAQREFGQWSMGFRRLGAAESVSHPAFAPFFEGGFDAQSIGAKPGLALDMLREFGTHQR